jgi:hypothetical protein
MIISDITCYPVYTGRQLNQHQHNDVWHMCILKYKKMQYEKPIIILCIRYKWSLRSFVDDLYRITAYQYEITTNQNTIQITKWNY